MNVKGYSLSDLFGRRAGDARELVGGKRVAFAVVAGDEEGVHPVDVEVEAQNFLEFVHHQIAVLIERSDGGGTVDLTREWRIGIGLLDGHGLEPPLLEARCPNRGHETRGSHARLGMGSMVGACGGECSGGPCETLAADDAPCQSAPPCTNRRDSRLRMRAPAH